MKSGERGGVVRRGQLEHQRSTGGEAVFGGPLIWTLTVERQEGPVFSGARASQNRSDPMVGALSANGRTLHLADDNGPVHGDLRGPDEMEICRTLADADTMLAMCRCCGGGADRSPVTRSASMAGSRLE